VLTVVQTFDLDANEVGCGNQIRLFGIPSLSGDGKRGLNADHDSSAAIRPR
jgi:hypothetical protein